MPTNNIHPQIYTTTNATHTHSATSMKAQTYICATEMAQENIAGNRANTFPLRYWQHTIASNTSLCAPYCDSIEIRCCIFFEYVLIA